MASGLSGQHSDLLRHLLDATWWLRLCAGMIQEREMGQCAGHELRVPGMRGRVLA